MTLTEFLLARIAEDEAQARRSQADMARNPQLNLPVSWVNGVAARVLAECEAKRAMLAAMDAHPGGCRIRIAMVRALLSVYSDHPDYREEWRG